MAYPTPQRKPSVAPQAAPSSKPLSIEEFLKTATEAQKQAWEADLVRIRDLTEPYKVARGDTLGGIANRHWLASHFPLVQINEYLKRPFAGGASHRLGSKEADIFVPKDAASAKIILGTIAAMHKKIEMIELARRITQGDTRALQQLVQKESPLYPKTPTALGIQDVLYAIAFHGTRPYYGGTDDDDRQPRVLGRDNSIAALCAQLINNIKWQSIPARDMSPAERRWLNEKNKHAWTMPLKEPDYVPLVDENGKELYNFNPLFDSNKLKAEDPIRAGRRWEYDHGVMELSRMLADPESHKLSAMEIFVQYALSGERLSGDKATPWLPPEKRIKATHLLFYNGTTAPDHPDERWRIPTKSLYGWEQPKLVKNPRDKDGGYIRTTFGHDTKGAESEITKLRENLSQELGKLRAARSEIDAALNPKNNAEIQQALEQRRKEVRSKLTVNDGKNVGVAMRLKPGLKVGQTPQYETDPEFLGYLETLILSDKPDAYQTYLADVAKGSTEFGGKHISLKGRWKMTPESWFWMTKQVWSKSARAIQGIDKLRDNLSNSVSMPPIDAKLAQSASTLPKMTDTIGRYNEHAAIIARLQPQIAERRSRLSVAEREEWSAAETLRSEITNLERELDAALEMCVRERIEMVSLAGRAKTWIDKSPEASRAFALRTILSERFPSLFGPDAYQTETTIAHAKYLLELCSKATDPQKALAEYKPLPETKSLKEDAEFFGLALPAAKSESALLASLTQISNEATRSFFSQRSPRADLADIIENNPRVNAAIGRYEASMSALKWAETTLQKKREAAEAPEESRRLSDFIIDYAQLTHHLDSPFSAVSRRKTTENLPAFAHALKVYIDGIPVEYVEPQIDPATGRPQVNPESGEIIYRFKDDAHMPRVRPSSKIEFYGPVVTDGIHLNQSPNEDEQERMNTRSESWATVMATGKFRPTNVRVPKPDSIFSLAGQAKIDATTPAGKLPFTHLWDIRDSDIDPKEKDWAKKSFGYFLQRKIRHNDAALIDELLAEKRKAKDATKWGTSDESTDREDIVEELYQYQCTALRLDGHMDIFGQLNPKSSDEGQLIPYYDLRTAAKRRAIHQADADFMKKVREQKLNEARDGAMFSNIVRLQVLPGDSSGTLFARLRAFVAVHADKKEFPNLALVDNLPAPAQQALLRAMLSQGTRLDENELRRIKAEDRARKKKKPIVFKARGLRDETDIDAFFGLKNEDVTVDRPVTPGETYAMNIAKLHEIIGSLTGIWEDIEKPSLPAYQEYLLNKMVPSPADRHYIGVTAMVESGSPKNSPPLRRSLKYMIEEMGQMLSVDIASSIGIFQHRLDGLRKGWDDPAQMPSWPNRKQLEAAIMRVDVADMRRYLLATKQDDSIVHTFEEDALLFEELKELVLDRTPAPKERLDRIMHLIETIARIGDGTAENILGCALSIPLQEDRRYDVMSHVSGFFKAMGEDVSAWYRTDGDVSKRALYNEVVNLASNQGEGNFALGLGQNYLLRITEALGLKWAEEALGASVQRTDRLGSFKGSLDYGPGAYGEAMYRLYLLLEEQLPSTTSKKTEEQLPLMTGERAEVAKALKEHAYVVAKRYMEYKVEHTDPIKRRGHIEKWLDETDAQSGLGLKARMLEVYDTGKNTPEELNAYGGLKGNATMVYEYFMNPSSKGIVFPFKQKETIPDPQTRKEYERIWKALLSPDAVIPSIFRPMSRDVRTHAFKFLQETKGKESQDHIKEAVQESAKFQGTPARPFETSILPTLREVMGEGQSASRVPFRWDFLGYVRKEIEGADPGRLLSIEEIETIRRKLMEKSPL